MAITAEKVGVHNEVMDKTSNAAVASASGRGSVTRISSVRRHARTADDIARAREARHGLKPRHERFAHLKRMHD